MRGNETLRRRVLNLAVIGALSALPALALSQDKTGASVGEDQARELDTVTVTAQGREQSAEDVPIALTVIGGEKIEELAVEDIGELAAFVPGLQVSSDSPTQPRFAIRGIATDDFGVGTDPAVGIYVDGVYAARSGASLLAFNDVERIEVLKGPQGTLFGRNSAAGAISIISREPVDDFEGRVGVRIGNYDKRYLDGVLNISTGKHSALRVTAVGSRSDGWLEDAVTGRDYFGDDQRGVRATWRYDFSGATRALFTYEHERLDQLARPAIGLIALAPNAVRPPYPPDPTGYLDPIDAPLRNDVIGNEESRDLDGATLRIEHQFDWAQFRSLTNWRQFNTLNREDEDGTNLPAVYFDTANIEDNRGWYQEFRFAGAGDGLDWVAGASYYREHAEQDSQTNTNSSAIDTLIRNINPAPTPDGSLFEFFSGVLEANGIPATLLGHDWRETMSNDGRFSAWSLFGDAIWQVGERSHFTFGARYTHDSKEFEWFNGRREAPGFDATLAALEALGFFDLAGVPRQAFDFDVVFALGAVDGVRVRRDDDWSDFSPRFVYDYRFNDATLGYVSLAKGYKAGGFNSVEVGSRFDNEDVWNLEVGVKGVQPEIGLAYSASTFYYIYSDRQAIFLDPNDDGSGIPRYLVDTSDEKAFGLEFDANWQASYALNLSFNAAWIDATFKDKLAASGADLSGDPTGEPYFSFAAGANYVWTLSNNSEFAAFVSHGYRGRRRCNADAALQGSCAVSPNFDAGGALNRTDARLQWNALAGDFDWSIAVYANNLFDEQEVLSVRNITTSVFGTPFAAITPPRFYGLELRADF